jgi:tetratricopeptide (TPR) repeat protein
LKYPYFTLLSLLFFLSCTPKKATKEKVIINPDYDKAFEFREQEISDSAFLYFNKAKAVFLQQKDSLSVGKCLVNMAIASIDKGDYFGSQEISIEALGYFNKSNKKHFIYLESNFHELGIASSYLKNYSQAIAFYNQSIPYAQDSASVLVTKNNIANAYSKIGNYQKSFAIFKSILNQKMSAENFARTLSNYAFNKWKQNANYNAKPELLEALHIREKENNFWGLNASYSHLADYHTLKQPDTALFYAHKMYVVAQKIKSPDDQLQSLLKIIKLSSVTETKRYFNIYQNLNDSLQNARSAAKNQFALIRYETEKSKAENSILQKDNSAKKYQIIILIFGILAIVIVGTLWFKKRKQRLELEAENKIRESQLRTSKKVHDVVANGLYRVMTEIENQEDIDKGHVLDKIEDLYEKSRDISYDKPEAAPQHFHEKISALLTSFATDDTKMLIAGNTPELWQKVNAGVQYEVEHVLQELMVNMKKHSSAGNVAVRFENQQDQIIIYYTDNGVGMQAGTPHSNGLRNTGNRINSINGAINFDATVEKGLKIQISFPVS